MLDLARDKTLTLFENTGQPCENCPDPDFGCPVRKDVYEIIKKKNESEITNEEFQKKKKEQFNR